MNSVKTYLCRLGIKLIHLWLAVERIIIKVFLRSTVEAKVREFYGLDGVNKNLVTVNNPEFYVHTANKSLIGFCESYTNGWISVKNIHEVVAHIMKAGNLRDYPVFKFKAFLDYLEFEVFHGTWSNESIEMASEHYNSGNDLFEEMLGADMNYSCALWLKPTDTLASAQRNKMTLLAQKMKLKPGMKVLEIGCGWGGMAQFLAQEYGVSVVATTDSVEGAKYASELCEGLNVEVRLSDCRDLVEKEEKFDRILAVEVFVYVGKNNYRKFFSNVHKCLKDDGIFLLHAIGSKEPRIPAVNNLHNAMIPASSIPYMKDIIEDSAGLLLIEDWSNIGVNYDKTALGWNENFQKVRSKYQKLNGEEFCRSWEFALQTYAALAKVKYLLVWHIVFSKTGIPGGHQ